jgi:hypothetical protein
MTAQVPLTADERDFVTSLYEASAAVFGPAPVYWLAPHEFQTWAKSRSLFQVEGGVRLTPADSTDAGRQQLSRLRRGLEARGLIHITHISDVSRSACLTVPGLVLAQQLTGKRCPPDLRAATHAILKTPAKRNRIEEIVQSLWCGSDH